MSTLADSMLSWKANLTTRATPEQVLTLRADVNAFADGVRLLESENAKLRHELDQWHRLTDGIELPEYPITEFKPKDLERENAKLQEEIEAAKHDLSLFSFELVASKLENAKLRKLVSNCHRWLAVNCEKGYAIPRNGLDAIEQSMRVLGIEV